MKSLVIIIMILDSQNELIVVHLFGGEEMTNSSTPTLMIFPQKNPKFGMREKEIYFAIRKMKL